jgi:predicted dehydrogenase
VAKQRIGIVGAGKISEIYLTNLTGMFGKRVQLGAITDVVEERAAEAACKYGIRHIKTVAELVKDPEIDIVLNITPPLLHYDVAMAAVNAGKHVFGEKPLCVKREQAPVLLKAAAAKGLRVGNAPDTFLGAGIQTCCKLIDDGWIGRPIAAAAFMMSHGPEHWHPAPEFFYKTGGGPMLDMGPYYLTALVTLLGPVSRVSGSAQMGFKTRTITSEPFCGKEISVETPTHIAGVLDFANGAVGTIITSFDVWAHDMPFIEIYGTEGTLSVPDPNYFLGSVKIRRYRAEEWQEIPLLFKDADPSAAGDNWRGIGITDMAEAITEGRPHRASGELAYHVLEIMCGIHDAPASGNYYKLTTNCTRPEPL